MELGLKGKKVLITGASKGLGRATALAFAREGASVGVIARTEKDLVSLVGDMGGEELGHGYVVADLIDDPIKTVEKLEKKIGNFDVVIHNLGGVPLHIKDALASVDEWLEVWRLNVGIGIEINNHIIPKMQKKGWGRVIHISSISGDSLRGRPPYAVAKSTLSSYAIALGRAVASSGVVVSAIKMGAYTYPGSYWDKASKDKLNDYLKHHQAIGRLAEVGDVVPSILFLSSNQAKFLTGATLPVDGGTM